MSKDPPSRGHRKTEAITIGLYPTDNELLDWVCEQIGCSRSDAVRRAITLLAGVVGQVRR